MFCKSSISTEEKERKSIQETANSELQSVMEMLKMTSFCCFKCRLLFKVTLHEYSGDLTFEHNRENALEEYNKALTLVSGSDWNNHLSSSGYEIVGEENESKNYFPPDVTKCTSLEDLICLKWELIRRKHSLHIHSKLGMSFLFMV